MPILRACIERVDGRGCPRYAAEGKSRCAEHEKQFEKGSRQRKGRTAATDAAWRKARKQALERAEYKCEKCGRTAEQARIDGTWLECHHLDYAGISAAHHDLDKIQVLCRTPCHEATFAATRKQQRTRRSRPERSAANKPPWMRTDL